jgi:hypothetical protein
MRRLIAAGSLAVLSMVGLTACPGSTSPPGGIDPVGLQKWQATLEHPKVVSNPPPLVRNVLNVAIRAGVPVVCPSLANQAAPEWRSFVTATCPLILQLPPLLELTQYVPLF